jgi:excinuclease UvrABC nuclease subunit
MRANQRWLFPHPRPLVERFGEDFFRRLPERPAVYLMCGSGEGVLYVGKAKNLKKRLGSYRVANPEKFPRRILRLLHRVTRIEWDECADDSAACFREDLLIAVLQPRFNRAGKVWPRNPGKHSTFNAQLRIIARRESVGRSELNVGCFQ